ncbi:hypothetical protein D3C71_1998640 [compost metagenome]
MALPKPRAELLIDLTRLHNFMLAVLRAKPATRLTRFGAQLLREHFGGMDGSR